jgi:hypothetical protein
MTEADLLHLQHRFTPTTHFSGLQINSISPNSLCPFGCYSLPSMDILKVLRRHIAPDDIVLEIGSGVGLYASIFSKSAFPNWIATDHPRTHAGWVHQHRIHAKPVLTEDPLSLLPPNRTGVLLTVWPEANSTYFMRYAEGFRGGIIVIVGCPDVTGDLEMWELFDKEFAPLEHHDVCVRSFMGFKDIESVAVWRKQGCEIRHRDEWDRLGGRQSENQVKGSSS